MAEILGAYAHSAGHLLGVLRVGLLGCLGVYRAARLCNVHGLERHYHCQASYIEGSESEKSHCQIQDHNFDSRDVGCLRLEKVTHGIFMGGV